MCFWFLLPLLFFSRQGFEDLVDELSASALASQKAEHDTHSAVNSYMQSFFEGELRTAKLKQQQHQVAEEQYLHDARKYFKLRPDSDPAALAKYAGSMATKKPFLDLQRYDIDVALKEMEDRQQLAVLKTLAEAVRIQKECHEESVARMEKCAEKIRALQANASGV